MEELNLLLGKGIKIYNRYISDNSISLLDRYKALVKYGRHFGKNESYVPNFPKIDINDYGEWNRYEYIECSRLVDRMAGKEKQEIIDKVIQYIVDKNLYSFRVDW
jgi:hypothetical protein